MRVLDVLGEICPLPEVKTKRALESMIPGEELKVLVDYPKSVEAIVRWVNRGKNRILDLKQVGPCQWEILIRRGENT